MGVAGATTVSDAGRRDYGAGATLASPTPGSSGGQCASCVSEFNGAPWLSPCWTARASLSPAGHRGGLLVASGRNVARNAHARLPELVHLRALPHLALKQPLDIIIETDESGFLAQSVDLPLYANGSDPKEALEGLAHEIEILWAELQEDDAFTDEWLTYKKFLAGVIVSQ